MDRGSLQISFFKSTLVLSTANFVCESQQLLDSPGHGGSLFNTKGHQQLSLAQLLKIVCI